jgi:hypothetical protein
MIGGDGHGDHDVEAGSARERGQADHDRRTIPLLFMSAWAMLGKQRGDDTANP